MNQRFLPLLLSAFVVACGAPKKDDSPPPAPKIHTSYRVVSGASMGAIGTGALTTMKPDAFDGSAMLGGTLDAALLLRSMDQFHLGSFCTLAELEAIKAQDPNKLNDPAAVTPCMKRPATIKWEHSQDFNHWVTTTNGGSFNRNMYLDIFEDLTLAYGNALYENPASPFAPPGVDALRIYQKPSDFCSKPTVVKGLRNAEYNPNGTYDSITFCDGQPEIWFCAGTNEIVDFCSDPANIASPLNATQETAFATSYCAAKGGAVKASKGEQPLMVLDNWGKVDACRLATRPFPVGLAVDLNGNGRRDYGEPIVNNGQERFSDFGTDGCEDSKEDGHGGCTGANASGDPNGDDYDADTNPNGTEKDWVFEPGEPFRDDGLDGVPGTGDFGEGNGQFDLSSGRRRLYERDMRTMYKGLDDTGKKRLNIYVDGGIRDVFNLGLMSKQFFGVVAKFAGDNAGSYRDFKAIPGMLDRRGLFNPWLGNWRQAPKNISVMYGNETPSDQDRINGEGDHVGDSQQAVDRFATLFGWMASQWPTLAKPSTTGGSDINSRLLTDQWFQSAALGAKRDYAIYLPPGYDAPENAETRYPVGFILHGYGMDPSGMAATAIIADPQMKSGMRPMILVFPSGRCCFRKLSTGERDCRENDDNGNSIEGQAGYARECNSGSFFSNGQGYESQSGIKYGDSFFELMQEVDTKYRTLQPAEVEAR
ncbi:MAG: hypothetical protein ACJ790_14675 [Myxococcaceae bacterium]